jgi:hypothetical protein
MKSIFESVSILSLLCSGFALAYFAFVERGYPWHSLAISMAAMLLYQVSEKCITIAEGKYYG